MKRNLVQNSFVGGVLSPLLEARDDIDQYHFSTRRLLNAITLPHGGARRRGGTRFVVAAKYADKAAKLIPFQFSTVQAYILEFGDLYIRLFANEARLESPPGTPIEVVTPYTEAQVSSLYWAQNADVMYLVQPSHFSYKLARTGATSFTHTKVTFKNGRAPLRPQNLTTTLTLTITGAGPYTLTWSSNPVSGGLVSGTDVGRAVRFKNSYYEITAVGSGTVATATLKVGTDTSGADADWALGCFSNTEGCNAVAFHEGRLWYLGFPFVPDWLVGSVSDDFDNFELKSAAATDAQNADKSIAKRLTGTKVNAGLWLTSADEQLVSGTSGSEFRLFGTDKDVITPTAAPLKQTTARGSAPIRPVVVDSTVFFIQRNARKLRALAFNIATDGYVSREQSILAEHILRNMTGAVDMIYQQDPSSVIWVIGCDGRVAGFTHEPDQNVIGAHLHRFGNKKSDAVESFAVIEQPAVPLDAQTGGSEDQVWLLTSREIDGAEVRYIEFLEHTFEPEFEDLPTKEELIEAMNDAYFVDCGATVDLPITIESATVASPAVFTSTAHGLSNGTRVRVRNIEPKLDTDDVVVPGFEQLNLGRYTIEDATANTFTLKTYPVAAAVSSVGYEPYMGDGNVRVEFNTLTGLSHLEGRRVQILLDGSVHEDRTVTAGVVSLSRFGSIAHVGLPYLTYLETQRIVSVTGLGGSHGQPGKVTHAVVRLHNTLGGEFGCGSAPRRFESLNMARAIDPMDQSPPLFSGDKLVRLEGSFDPERDGPLTVYCRQTKPLPMTILGIFPQADFRGS